MILTPFDIYLIMNMDNISNLFGVVAVFSGFFGVISLFALGAMLFSLYDNDDKEDRKKLTMIKKAVKWCAVVFFSTLIIGSLIPSTKTLTAMYLIPQLSNSQLIQKLPDELQQYIDKVVSNK